MKDQELQALERLVKKLTTLRKTLEGDEQVFLDYIVTASQPEVALHAATGRAVDGKVTPKVVSAVEEGAVAEEVTLHAATDMAAEVGKVTPKVVSAVEEGAVAEDVTLHAATDMAAEVGKITPKVVSAVTEEVTLHAATGRADVGEIIPRVQFRIILDEQADKFVVKRLQV